MKTAAVYIRVSTGDQLEYSPDAQLKEARKYAEAHDMQICEDFIYLDEGISGRHAKKRPGFNCMIAAAKARPAPFDVILLWKFSRFARNQEESIVYKSMLRKDGVDVISISEPLAEGPFGTLIERIIEWMDEYYSIRLAGEVVRGMTEKASRGEFQSSPPFGYSKLPGQPLVPVPSEARQIRAIFDHFLRGETIFSIAGLLNDSGIRTKRGNRFDNRTVEYILHNPIYKGCVRWTPTGKTVGKRIYDSPDTITEKSDHPAIISPDIFDLAQDRLKQLQAGRKRRDRPADSKKHPFSGLLKCSACGSSLAYSQANRGFQCIRYAHGSCKPSHFILATKAEETVHAALQPINRTGSYVKRPISAAVAANSQDQLLQELSSAEQMLERARRAFLAGVDSLEEYERSKKEIQETIRKQTDLLSRLPCANQPCSLASALQRQTSILSFLSGDATLPEKNTALHAIIEKLVFCRSEGKLTIYLYQ